MTQPNKNNPSQPSADATSPEEIRRASQENQDLHQPDQDKLAQNGQEPIANDSSTLGYGVSGDTGSKPRTNGLDSQDDRVDDLGDSP